MTRALAGPYIVPRLVSMHPIASLFYVLMAILHLLSGVSYSACRFFITGFKLALCLAAGESGDSTSYQDELPNRVEDILNFLALEPKARSFVCCPKCFYIYDIESPFPDKCTNVEHPDDDLCNRSLRSSGRGKRLMPVRQYLMQDFGEWLARLYARPGMEAVLDHEPGDRSHPSGIMTDIWDAPILRDFKDSEGKPFFGGQKKDSRLAFSLNMDGFNPLTNKQAGKKISTCGIYLVCFNIPPESRYRSENVFLVGVIPGPTEPSQHQINYILKPLVDDFLSLWEKGLYLMRTPKYAGGRRVKAVILPLVCDLPAARLMAGMGSHGFMFPCSECFINRRNMEDLDSSNWPRCSAKEHRKASLRWRDASTESRRRTLFRDTGIRWSELLRLPYWDPTRYIVIDPMHCFYLGLFRRHVNDVWGMNSTSFDGDGLDFQTTGSIPGEAEMAQARKVFLSGVGFKNLKRHVLAALSWELGLRYVGRKAKLISNLEAVCLPRCCIQYYC